VALALRSGPQPLRGFADIAPGQRIGVMINSVASKVLGERGVHTVPYAFERDMIEDAGKGEIDGAAATPATIQYYMHMHPDSGMRYAPAYEAEPELQWALAVGMRRSDPALVDAVNAALDELRVQGELARIYARYGVEYRTP
jgi:polar amino acid transport system substrate-binding protein